MELVLTFIVLGSISTHNIMLKVLRVCLNIPSVIKPDLKYPTLTLLDGLQFDEKT